MLDEQLTLFAFVFMRITGFVVFNPIWGRRNVPGLVKAGIIMVLSICVYSIYPQPVAVPQSNLEYAVRLLLELAVGYALGLVVNFFLYIVLLAGDTIDMQMGMSMAKMYDAASQSSISLTSTWLNILMILLFFVCNGHITLFQILLSSGEVIPFGMAQIGTEPAARILELFVACTILAVKLSMPILVAQLLGQIGIGILMKVIPQINVFAVNIEFKIIVGLLLLILLMAPMGEFLLEAEREMLVAMRELLAMMAG